MEERIKHIMAAVLEMDSLSIDDKATFDSVEKWDSLRHINLVLAFEEEFGVFFDDDEIMEIVTYPLIKEMIYKKTKELTPS